VRAARIVYDHDGLSVSSIRGDEFTSFALALTIAMVNSPGSASMQRLRRNQRSPNGETRWLLASDARFFIFAVPVDLDQWRRLFGVVGKTCDVK
jgi:hypothetical protein